MKQKLNEVQRLQKIAGIAKEELSTEEQSVDTSKFLDKEEVPGVSEMEEGLDDIRAFVKKEDEKAARLKKIWDSLKGMQFTHRDDPKKTVYTIATVMYPKTSDGKAVLTGYPKNLNHLVILNWKGKKPGSHDFFKLNHAVANLKDGTWIPVK
jgi:hypothetical protein